MLDVPVPDVVLGTVAIEHLADRFGVAVADEVEPFVLAGELQRVIRGMGVRCMRLHVVKVQKERCLQELELLEYPAVEAGTVAPHATFDKAVETAPETSVGVVFARRLADDGALRHRYGVVPVLIEDFRDGGIFGGDSELIFPLMGEDIRVARGHQRIDRRKGAACLGPCVFENHGAGSEFIEIRRGRPVVDVRAHVVCTKGVDENDDDVRSGGGLGRDLTASSGHGQNTTEDTRDSAEHAATLT